MADAHSETEKKPSEIVSDVIEARKASTRWYNSNYWAEFAEIYRNIHARTKPLHYKDDKTGEEREDLTRTNVCVPDHFVMLRRGTSRLTRNPPNLRVRGGPDNDQAAQKRDMIGAHLMFQWDRAEAQRAFKRIVSMAYGLGWAVGTTWYDEVSVIRRLKRLTKTLGPSDMSNLTNSRDPQIAALMQQFGDRIKSQEPASPEESAMMMQAIGDQASLNIPVTKYKGPVLAAPFIGDVFPEPGFQTLDESGYVCEMSMEDEDFFKYWLKQVSIDPFTGEEKPVFDQKAVDKVMGVMGSRQYIDEQELSLRRFFREEIEIADPQTAGKPIKAPRKRALVDRRHTIVDGQLCVDFVGEEKEYLGRLWYPWETYGKYMYTEMVLIPDWLGGIGLSTLGVSRFLIQLRNTRMNQTTDFVNNKLLPLMKARRGADYTQYDLVRTAWARVFETDNPADFEFQQDPNFPAEAWQDQAQLQQQLQQVEPASTDFAPGTSSVAQSGKFATTANLTAKSSDNLTADTLDQIGLFIRDVVEKWLWMNQQAMNEDQAIPGSYLDRITALSSRTSGGHPKEIRITPMDIQEDYEILPEQGSTLAADDEFRVAGLQQFYQIAAQHPDVVNIRAVITALARATPGINAEDIILPPPPPQPPVPPVKMNISLTVKWEQLPPDVQAAILQHEGLPTELTHVEGMEKMIRKTSDAADAASNLEAPVDHTIQPPGENGGGKAPRGAAKSK